MSCGVLRRRRTVLHLLLRGRLESSRNMGFHTGLGGTLTGSASDGMIGTAVMCVSRANESGEKRVRFKGLRFELRVKLAADKPGMVRRFDNFDVRTIGGASRETETGSQES